MALPRSGYLVRSRDPNEAQATLIARPARGPGNGAEVLGTGAMQESSAGQLQR